MSGITNALELYRAELQIDNGSRAIYQAAQAALAPFHTGTVTVYIKDTFLSDVLFLNIQTLPGVEFAINLNLDSARGHPEHMFNQVADNIFNQIKSIPRIEPPENCLLGEN